MFKKNTLITCIIFFSLGFVFFLVRHQVVILNLPKLTLYSSNPKLYEHAVFRKEINFYMSENDREYIEKTPIIWKKDAVYDLKNLVNTWLSFVYDEHITQRKVFLETVILSGSVAYLSFDGPILSSEWSVFKKIKFLESLLKTIKKSQVPISYIIFLTRHKEMQDDHIDFSVKWPTEGFINS